MVYVFLFGLILTGMHYLSEYLDKVFGKRRSQLLSFSAGVSIAYVFLELLPTSFKSYEQLHQGLFLLILTGFCLFHLTEKYLYQHQQPNHGKADLTKTHFYAFFFYHFVIGVILYQLTSQDFTEGLLFFIPLAFHTMASTASMTEVHHSFRRDTLNKFALANSTLAGVIVSSFINIGTFAHQSLFAFLVGMLLYVVIRDMLPQNQKGDPRYFVGGVALYTFVMMFIIGTII
jgi:zinc transporter ZupT